MPEASPSRSSPRVRRRTVLLVVAAMLLVVGAAAAWKRKAISDTMRFSPAYARIARTAVLEDILPRPVLNRRLVTGIAAGGTAARPVLYVTSSDPRVPGTNPEQSLSDTNSGVLSRLTLVGGGWRHEQLVRGLPRSYHEHAPNGLVVDEEHDVAYLAVGSMTDNGAPSFHFEFLPEYALSAALLRIDLRALGPPPHDLATLDDPTHEGDPDAADPFGGNRGLNQARLVEGGPIQLHTTGLRNPYDVHLARSGRLYVTDNGPNAGGGGTVRNGCSNEPRTGGPGRADSLRDVTPPGIYGGHPNPTRGGALTHPDQKGRPIAEPDPRQCSFLPVAAVPGVVTTFDGSTNGLTEYTSTALGGALTGRLLTVSLNGSLVAVDPKRRGATAQTVLSTRVGIAPLDVTAVGDDGRFPGSIWIADWAAGEIVVLEPRQDARCQPVTGRCFRRTTLSGAKLDHPTSLAWGPDGRLYASEQDGLLRIYTVERGGDGALAVVGTETIAAVRDIPNHDDDGRPAARLPLVD